jgi:hypothetical protein
VVRVVRVDARSLPPPRRTRGNPGTALHSTRTLDSVSPRLVPCLVGSARPRHYPKGAAIMYGVLVPTHQPEQQQVKRKGRLVALALA